MDVEITRIELYIIRQALEVALIEINKKKNIPLTKSSVESTIDTIDKLTDYCGACDSIGIK